MAVIKCAECSGTVSTDAKRCPHCGAGKKKFKGGSKNLLIHGFVAFVAIGLLGNLLPDSEEESDSQTREVVSKVTSEVASIPQSPQVGTDKICKAAISLIFGQPADSISVSGTERTVELSYERSVDNSNWRYRCKVEGNQIIWAGFVDGQWGRWRDGSYDAKITYRARTDKLMVSERYPDSKASTQTFNLSEL